MNDIVSDILLISGSALLLIAAIGIFRMPDLFTRMQAGTKASTLGVGLVLISLAVQFDDTIVRSLAIAGIAFFLLTAPVAAHMISRAAYFVGVPMWERTIIDEWHGRAELLARQGEVERGPLDERAIAEDARARREGREGYDAHA